MMDMTVLLMKVVVVVLRSLLLFELAVGFGTKGVGTPTAWITHLAGVLWHDVVCM